MKKKVVDLQGNDRIELLNLVFDICTDSSGKKLSQRSILTSRLMRIAINKQTFDIKCHRT